MEALITGILFPVVLVLIAFMILGFVMTRMYRRSTREVSLVRTGAGGRKVIMDGGVFVVPVLHEITFINMKTTRLEVRRDGVSALITKDRMRVDVGVEFYVTVQGSSEGIARAAQTLGDRTFNTDALREMVEGKLVDALRSVAAQMSLDELHENRSDFVQQVQQTVAEDLTKNGLELESVSLTALDQTPMDTLDEDNVFNATGMKNQVERIAESKKRRAEIDAETKVAVLRSVQEGEIKAYEIERQQEEARVAQAIELETLRSREAIDRAKKTQEAEREAEQARIAREKSVEAAQIERTKELEIAEQDRQIAIQQKSEEESRAKAAADTARAEAVKAEEQVKTERDVAEAERQKRVTILIAEQEAEEKATGIRVTAAAEKEAAVDRGAALREMAQAEADEKAIAIRVSAAAAKEEAVDRAAALREMAQAQAEEITIRAEALKKEKLADAEGKREQIAAENTLSEAVIQYRLDIEKYTVLPEIVREMVKPAEKINGITIHKVDGLGAGGGSNGGSGGNGETGLVNQAFDELRAMAFQMPALKSIGESVGVNLDNGINGVLGDNFAPSSKPAGTDAKPNGKAAE
ncbi:flotillin family protein [Roseovarius sp. EL26]|uniref:flotillin family protein n=1 Tax=Roseovarius sp. EL26 TaxID=2126672 RepID=UPI000EA32469|nr:flotillin domain-containing protein [Roseovarius sp. EL26]